MSAAQQRREKAKRVLATQVGIQSKIDKKAASLKALKEDLKTAKKAMKNLTKLGNKKMINNMSSVIANIKSKIDKLSHNSSHK